MEKNNKVFLEKIKQVFEDDKLQFRKFNKPRYEIGTPVIYFDKYASLNNAINNWIIIWYKWQIVKTDKTFVWNVQKISYIYTIITISWNWSSILYAKDIPEQNIYDEKDLFDNQENNKDDNNN